MTKFLTPVLGLTMLLFGTVSSAQDLSAVVSSAQVAVLSSPRGGQIVELPVALGKHVKSGDLLAQFECDVEVGQLAAADAELQIAAIDVKSQRTLVARGAGGRTALSQAIAREKLQVAQRDIANAKVAQCSVIAPFAGAVADLSVKAYETVQAGTPLLELVNTEALLLEVIVPSEWIEQLLPGKALIFKTSVTQKDYPARIVLVAPKIDGISQTIRIIAEFDATQNLPLPGSAGYVSFK